MKQIFRIVPLCIVVLAGLFLSVGLRARPQAAAPTVVEISAKMFDFTPDEVRVKKGAHVQLKVKATDKTHGIQISPFADGAERTGAPGLRFDPPDKTNFRLEKDQEVVIDFVADRAGTYSFKCSVMCGMGHSDMAGAIIVEE